MKDYEWVMFDADETLFHFDAFSGLKHMFKDYDVDFRQADYERYQQVNQPLWVQYQQGVISAEQLKTTRFQTWSTQLGVEAHVLNQGFLRSMAEICTPIEGAEELLQTIHNKAKLGIITNGFSDLQDIRLTRTGFKKYFEFIVISEEVGVAKPHPEIFSHALTLMENPCPTKVLMVGDNLHSDMAGAKKAGMDTCWLNRKHYCTPAFITPKFEVKTLEALRRQLHKIYH